MQLAESAISGTYATVGLHVKWPDAGHVGFHTRLEPGPFTEMVASACVIAQLELVKSGANLFDWTIDEGMIDGLLRQARELNDASAGAVLAASGSSDASG